MKYYVEVIDGNTKWYKDAKRTILHREDGPAYIDADGSRAWYLNGKRHREDGPAIFYENGSRAWFLNGCRYSEEEFRAKTNPVKELTVADIEKLLGHKVKVVS